MKTRNETTYQEVVEFDSDINDLLIRFTRTTDWVRSRDDRGYLEWEVEDDFAMDIEVENGQRQVTKLAELQDSERAAVQAAVANYMAQNGPETDIDGASEPDWDSLADEKRERENEDW